MHFELLLTGRIPNGKGNKNLDLRTKLRMQVHDQLSAAWEANPLASRPELLAQVGPPYYSAVSESWGRTLVAPVRESLDTACKLDVIFYEPAGSLEVASSVADPDNRIAGLLDLLAIPTSEKAASLLPLHVHALLEDDKLVWALNIERRRLLRTVENEQMFTRVVVRVFPLPPPPQTQRLSTSRFTDQSVPPAIGAT